MERKIPLPMLILAILGFCYLLFPILVVVLAGLTTGEFSDLSRPKACRCAGSSLSCNSRKVPVGILLFIQAGADDDGGLDHPGHGGGLFLARSRFVGRAALRAFFLSPVVLPGGRRVCPLCVLHHQRIGHFAHDLGLVDRAHPVLDTLRYRHGRRIAGDLRCLSGRGRAQPWRIAHAGVSQDHFPNIAQGIQAGSIFAFIVSFGQFEVSLFLSAPNSEPLPIAMYNSLRYKFEPDAAAAGIFAITLVIASVLLTNRLVNIRRLLERQDG